jgi:hypothetical protein
MRTVEGVDSTCVGARRRQRVQRPDRLGEEWASIEAGIDLIAFGAARRVMLCGLRFAERLLPDAVVQGERAGLRVSLDRSSEGSAAIVVAAADVARRH